MRRIVEQTDDGLDRFLGQYVLVICGAYFYHGKMVALNESHLVLASPKIVYETGDWSAEDWKDAQALPGDEWTIMLVAIESIGVTHA